MLENSIYSVISPEGCASILWRDPGKSLQAAEAMKLTAKDLLSLGIIDEIIDEPIGGAHRDHVVVSQNIKASLIKNLNFFANMSGAEIYDHRKTKFLKIGREKGFTSTTVSELGYKETNFIKIQRNVNKFKFIYIAAAVLIIAAFYKFF